MNATQLSLFADIDEKEIRRIVARELKQYKALKIAMKNKSELNEEGISPLFPSLNKKDKEKEIKVRQIDRAIENALNEVERQIIQQKYLSSIRIKDSTLYSNIGLKKDHYYYHKRQAILLIATALGII